MLFLPYDRSRAYRYAQRWAYERNPLFYNFTGIGGDCSNFVSQCIFAGCCTMNFTETYGWYYRSVNDRAPAWTSVEYLYNFLTTNSRVGPFGDELPLDQLEVGDIIQLQNEEGRYYHSVMVSRIEDDDIFVASHSNDAFDRPLSTYSYASARGIHIYGYIANTLFCPCFNALLDGTKLVLCNNP